MNKFIAIFLLTFSLSAQTLLNETFSNFIDRADTADCKLFVVLDSAWLAAYGGSDNQMIEDLSPFQNDLAVGGWASYGAMLDSTDLASSIYSGGLVARFTHASKNYIYDASNSAITIGSGDWTLLTSYYCTNLTAAWRLHLSFFGHGTTQDQGAVFYVSATHTQDFDLTARAGPNGTPARTVNTWYFGATTHNNTTGNVQMYVNGAAHASATAMNPNITGTEVGIGHFTSNIAQDWGFNGGIEVIKVYNKLLSDNQLKAFGFLAAGWAATDTNVTRTLSSGNYLFHQGVVSDTVWYNTTLTTGTWSISVSIDGASGGEAYQILTSADASTWTAIATGTATTANPLVIVTGTGLGYIGLGVGDGDTVYFDNLLISKAAIDSRFKKNKGWSKFKSW